jgi:hypothetical protein
MMEARGNYSAPEDLNRWQTIALGVGGISAIVMLVAALIGTPEQKEQALRSWLLGFIFWGGIGIGSLGVLILQYLTGGAWGVVSRRILEAASRTLPIIAILFLPIFFGVTYLYEWTHLPPDDFTVQHRGMYQTPLWWMIRSALYFILWGSMVYFLNLWGRRQDETTNYTDSAKYLEDASKFSGPTMVFYVLTVTFAVVDWVMSLDPHWFSTMWGFLFVAGWGLSTFAFVIVILTLLSDKAPMNRVLGTRHFHDIGKLMLALVMVWAYFNFSQYLIIWSGNIPEETTWYLTRSSGGWGWIGLILIFFHFAFPFLVLLSRDIKRNRKYLAMVAVFILVLRLVDMFYLIAPNPRIHPIVGFHLSWMDLVAPVAVGGIWLWWFFRELQRRWLVPANDPFFESAIEHGKGH